MSTETGADQPDEWDEHEPHRSRLGHLLHYRHGLIPACIVAVGLIVAGILVFLAFASDDDDGGGGSGELRQPVHWHADFRVVIRGQAIDFGDPKYISTAEAELSANVHIHDPRHSVVHVHREQTTWDEFFRSLGWELTDTTFGIDIGKTCMETADGEKLCNTETETWKFVVNGVLVDGLSLETIGPLQRVLFSYGPETREQAMAQFGDVSDEACIPSGLCLERGGGAGEHGEPEPCSSTSGQCTGN